MTDLIANFMKRYKKDILKLLVKKKNKYLIVNSNLELKKNKEIIIKKINDLIK